MTVLVRLLVCGFLVVMLSLLVAVDYSSIATKGATQVTKSGAMMRSTAVDPQRLCTQNQYIPSLSLNFSELTIQMDSWLDREVVIEREIRADPSSMEHTHKRFDAFEVMGACADVDCLGGRCGRDAAKIVCGVKHLKNTTKPCVVYSIGSNNLWTFELDVLAKTSCEVHTFDCTGPRSRFEVPEVNYFNHSLGGRLHFHHVCLGTKNLPAPEEAPTPEAGNVIYGEMWTLAKMQSTLSHTQVDLLKMDIEGYEWPLLSSWPDLTDISSPSTVLPMQVLMEVHYQTQMKDLSTTDIHDFKYSTDMIRLQSHLLKMGYVIAVRDNNRKCMHCTELTAMRVRCPPEMKSIV